MTKKETLKWRLSKLPTSEEVISLVKDKIITQDEARSILFSLETEEERDKQGLEAEIKFLRELVDKLANRSSIVETVKLIEQPYIKWHWYQPYMSWCSSQGNTVYTASTSTNLLDQASMAAGNTWATQAASNFQDIQTF